MRKLGDFFKRIKVEEKIEPVVKNTDIQDVQIEIEGNVELFKDEKEKIIQGARQLLELGRADDMEDAIITFATMFRGLRFSKVQKCEDGKKVIVLRETAGFDLGDRE